MTFPARTVEQALMRVREICLGLPGGFEKLSHGSPSFFVLTPTGKLGKSFVMFVADHHGDGRLALWCKAPDGVQKELVGQEPDRFFVPPYVGPAGWIGVLLHPDPDWDEVAAICEEAYRTVAHRKRVAELDARSADR